MALYRTISLSFWNDTKIIDDFTPEDKYFFLYLLTNIHTNIVGCYEISKRTMSEETGYNVDVIENLLERFINKHEVVDYDNSTKELLVVNWHKYNWTSSARLISGVEKSIRTIKNPKFRDYVEQVLECHKSQSEIYPIYTVHDTCMHCMDTSVTDTINNIYINNNTKVSDKEYVEDIDNINVEVDKEVYSEERPHVKEPKKSKRADMPKHQYGEYKHVLLTDDEYERLKTDLGEAVRDKYIRNLDEYLEEHRSKHYDNHNLTIRKWERKDRENKSTPQGKAPPGKSGGGEYQWSEEVLKGNIFG